ncbi:hypothetical protein [Candidatus Liberibacter sp.]|uniref:hypothetical protein n=1 Tax=Candidatus Liberibacter sp. TaxID=34022 RepID=UPI0015F71D45|nr:hypothetical protein [Candidatus Liberibacter sp.]MBA5724368.1 hypothetical protein [Candidatus Liberibacter sp.]
MISKKNALTSVLLSSTVLLNDCDWLVSEPRIPTVERAQIPATDTSSSINTEE